MPTQQALYADLAERSFDPELSWAEHELPERLRTKHVHRLHPYLGKFVPQLVERFLARHFRPGQRILDPFAGSGTTLVECSTFGANSVGVDVSAFNVLLCSVKTGRYDAVRRRARSDRGAAGGRGGERRAGRRPARASTCARGITRTPWVSCWATARPSAVRPSTPTWPGWC